MDLHPLRNGRKKPTPLLSSAQYQTRHRGSVPHKGCLPRSTRVGLRGPRRLQGGAETEPGKGEEQSKQNSHHVLASCPLEPSRAQEGRKDTSPQDAAAREGKGPWFLQVPDLLNLQGSHMRPLTPATTTGRPLPAQGVLQRGSS